MRYLGNVGTFVLTASTTKAWIHVSVEIWAVACGYWGLCDKVIIAMLECNWLQGTLCFRNKIAYKKSVSYRYLCRYRYNLDSQWSCLQFYGNNPDNAWKYLQWLEEICTTANRFLSLLHNLEKWFISEATEAGLKQNSVKHRKSRDKIILSYA